MDAKLWIIVRSENDHNQHGDYFVAAYTSKPTPEEISKTLNCSKELAKHISKDGGRIDFEGTWFNLCEINSGEHY